MSFLEAEAERPNKLFPLALVLLGGGFHTFCLQMGFVSDDYVLLEAVRADGFRWLAPFPAGNPAYFRPLVLLSLALTPSNEPMFHHLLNLIIHLGCTLMVYACARHLQASRMLAFLVGLWFCLHLANMTDLYWISGRTDSLSTLFFLWGFYAFLRLLDAPNPRWVIAVWFFMAAALLTKEQTVVFAPVCFFWFWYRSRQNRRPSPACRVCLGGMAVLTLAYLAFILWFSKTVAPHAGFPLIDIGQVLRNLVKGSIFLVSPFSTDWMAQHRGLTLALSVLTLVVLAIGTWQLYLKKAGAPDPKTVAVYAALVLGAMMPAAAFLSEASPRLLYLPIALMAIVGARWLMRNHHWYRWMFCLSLMTMVIASTYEASQWLGNDVLAKRCAKDFVRVMATVDPERPFVVLGAPATRNGRLVFGNDMNHAFYHAAYGTFGRFHRGSAVGQIDWRGATLVIDGEKIGEGSYRRRIAPPSAFIYDKSAEIGSEFRYGPGKTVIIDLHGPGRVSAFEFSFRSKLLKEKPLVFDFDGRTMIRLQ